MIETINLYGMSVDKFKRTLRLILIENIYENPFYFVHLTCLDTDKAIKNSSQGFSDSKFNEKTLLGNKAHLLTKFEEGLKMMDHESSTKVNATLIFDEIVEYSKQKR